MTRKPTTITIKTMEGAPTLPFLGLTPERYAEQVAKLAAAGIPTEDDELIEQVAQAINHVPWLPGFCVAPETHMTVEDRREHVRNQARRALATLILIAAEGSAT